MSYFTENDIKRINLYFKKDFFSRKELFELHTEGWKCIEDKNYKNYYVNTSLVFYYRKDNKSLNCNTNIIIKIFGHSYNWLNDSLNSFFIEVAKEYFCIEVKNVHSFSESDNK